MRIFYLFLQLNFLLQCVAASEKNMATFVSPSNGITSFGRTTAGIQKSRNVQFLTLSSQVSTRQLFVLQKQRILYRMLNSGDATELPPHTALARVLANQYNIDLSSIEPSKKVPNAQITAADVEFHAYKLSQPPCTPQALELAYSYGLDLTDLYDEFADNEEDESGEKYFLRISDVQLYKDNIRSLRASSQKVLGETDDNLPADVKRRKRKLNRLEERMEKNVGQLSQRAMQAIGTVATIVQTVQSQVKLPDPVGMFMPGNKLNGKVNSVQDFDQELANEIQAALLSAGIDDEETANLLSMLDMPLNGSTDRVESSHENSSVQSGCNGIEMESKHDKIPSVLFFADPK
ncbi:hypothetical protein ACHAW6_006019 [Cyclotella cf. meneghiniana]